MLKKLLSSIFLIFLFVSASSHAAIIDAPHNETNGMTCTNCHTYSLWWQFSPMDNHPQRVGRINTICDQCHGTSGPQITEVTHSSLSMASLHRSELGDWARACTDCHNPHIQAQLEWQGTVPDSELYLVTGNLTAGTLSLTGTGSSASPYFSTFQYNSIITRANWDNITSPWTAKSGTNGRGLILCLPRTNPSATFEVTAVNETTGEITVRGNIDSAYDTGADFGLLYGQLIRSQVDGAGGPSDVQFFDPNGGFVDQINNKGLCQVCHTKTNHFQYDAINPSTDHAERTDTLGATGANARCTYCHKHGRGFAPGSDSGKHPQHLAMGVDCTVCHVDQNIPDPLTATGCDNCHQDGKGGLPNDRDFRYHWNDQDPAYSLNCNSCHNGRLQAEDIDTGCLHTDPAVDGQCTTPAQIFCDPVRPCDDCHTGPKPLTCIIDAGHPECNSCHNGSGTITGLPNNRDIQAPPVGMQTGGHDRLASSHWVRQYPCTYCHIETVDSAWNLLSKHANGAINVDINSQWAIVDMPAPSYDLASKTCDNVYCHSDGTTLNPEVRPYTWTEGHKECNSCHGHNPSENGCNASGCHTDGRDGTYWNKFPEKKWLSAMPMYPNTGPLTDKANSHYRHLFSGFSCDNCHFATIAGGSCLNCHNTTIPTGTMSETKHINPQFHVNRTKNIVFKDGGTYDPATKTCANTACHTGNVPQWGGSVYDSIVCRDCHGTSGIDVDDFAKFNGIRAKISLGQWANTGHGRPGVIDPASGLPDPAVNPYASGNPPANFPDNGCWYCHDSKVLHENKERPFRLIEHEHFKNRFEKECVFCHMSGVDVECLGCHNDTESLAPQLTTIAPLPGVINPPYSIERPDHTPFVDGQTSCVTICHPNDDYRHKTGAGIWDQKKKDDVKNSYVKMGVCLICHDDDSSGQCATCHAGDARHSLGFDPADTDPALVGKTAGRIVAQTAKAASVHFGHKHYNDYTNSLADQLDSGTVSETSTSTRQLIDTSKLWSTDAFAGRRIKITSGINSGLSRPILSNTVDTITVAPPFPSGQLLAVNDAYEIIDIVWKGGKFCWDCHDPHGDNNLYMIQNEVASRTDGVVGRPITRKEVFFTRKSSGADYARSSPNPDTGNYDGLCNVCHTDPSMHYTSDHGDGHNAGRACTECHEHRFTNSHASGQACNTCHRNRPVPRHTAFSQARDCTKCHKGSIGKRMNIMKQFSANSHHVQSDKVTARDCYACHWEATKYGTINREHHSGYNNKTYVSVPNQEVDLVIWQAGKRPTVYDNDGLNGDDTATTFLAADIDPNQPGGSMAKQRAQVENTTSHCLGCHSDQNNDTMPFNLVDPANGDCKTPRQYAWDQSSIASRYANTTTATWGKYNNSNTAKKAITKAFSAHGNATANQGGWDLATGVDENIPNTRNGSFNVQCFDCHSSHGSMVAGITSSYTTFNGTNNGANLKETQAGKGGYADSYLATSNPDPAAVNSYQTGAGECFDCHESSAMGIQVSPVARTPWGYNQTFGATSPIIGYLDNPHFLGNYPQSSRFPFLNGKQTLGGHLHASHRNPASPNYDNSGASDLVTQGTINGLCTPCHDPHGVSQSLGAKMAYALPMLKGTWLTSPYKDDAPPLIDDGYNGSNAFQNTYNSWPSLKPYPQKSDPQPSGVWRTDRNTFNSVDLGVKANNPAGYGRITEDADSFAGLCLRCHPKENLTTDAAIEPTDNIPWASKERIHRSVKGWGWTAGEPEREHSYICAKCHQPHASGLPRLMKTNCLDYSHRGRQLSGGTPLANQSFGYNYRYGRFPYGWWNGAFADYSTATCHGQSNANGSSGWPDNQSWNNVTPWTGGN